MGQPTGDEAARVAALLAEFHSTREAARVTRDAAQVAVDNLAEAVNLYRPYLQAIGNEELRTDAARARLGASDVFQDVWVIARKNLDQLQAHTPAEFGGWLRVIYVNELRRQAETAHRSAANARESGERDESPPPTDPQEVSAVLETALSVLSVTDRAIVVLRDAHDWKYAAIGHVLGVTEDHARYRYSLARLAMGIEE